MESARPSLIRKIMPPLIAFSLGFVLAGPDGFVARVGYWIPGVDKIAALDRLLEAEPGGGETELAHAIASDDKDLCLHGAVLLARKGDVSGIKKLVQLCPPSGDASHPARGALETLLVRPELINHYDSVQEWYRSTKHVLHHESEARWSSRSNY